MFCAGGISCRDSLLHLGFERDEPVALGEALGRGTRRFGGSDKAIPPPDVAFARNEALARLQLRLDSGTDIRETTPTWARLRHRAGGA